jgi:hypothetical protein
MVKSALLVTSTSKDETRSEMDNSMQVKQTERPGHPVPRWQPALRDMLTLLALTAAVWLLHIYGRTLPTAALVAVWIVLTALIVIGLFVRARIRRAAFVAAYIRHGSPLEQLLRGGWLMAARALPVAALVALILMIALIRLDDAAGWVVLIGSIPIIVLMHRWLRTAFARHVGAAYLPELAWRVTAVTIGALMVTALVVLASFRPYPDLGAVDLERAVWHFVGRERARSETAETVLQLAAAKDALRLWLAQQLMPAPGGSLAQALGWLVVLAEEAVFVWSYLLLCGSVLIGMSRNDRSGIDKR